MIYKTFFLFLFIVSGFFVAHSAEAKALLPNGAGSYSLWANFNCDADKPHDCVKEYPTNDGDATYASTTAENALQSYNFANNSDSATVRGVSVVVYAKANAAPAEKLRLFLRIGGVDNFPDAANDCILTATEYTRCSYYWDKNPSNSQNWTTSDLTGLEAGFKTIAIGTWDGAEHRVSQIYLDIDFKSETKKIKYHVVQKILPVNGAVDDNMDFSIADPIDEVRSAFVEINGLAVPSAVNLGVTVNNDPATPGFYDATYNINSAGRPTFFKVNYDVTDYFKSFVTSAGSYTRYIHLNTNSNVYLLNAKLTVVYSYIIAPQVTGSYRIKGDLVSATFDTGATEGAAYNSIMWKGILGGPGQNQGKVRLQLATSNNPNGPWDSNNFVGGATCSNGDWWEALYPYSDTPVETKCFLALNNKRYFRYKIRICSNDCSDGGNYTPTVNDVVVSWSP